MNAVNPILFLIKVSPLLEAHDWLEAPGSVRAMLIDELNP
jgi:hypothetical protein